MRRCPVFTKPQLNLMADYIRRTVEDGRERGFNMTGEIDDISFIDQCLGDECSVRVKPRFGTYGSFHTHPPGKGTTPSSMDVYGALLQSQKAICIGAAPQGKPSLRCYVTDMFETEDWWRAFENAAAIQGDISDAIRYQGMNPNQAYEMRMNDIFNLVRNEVWKLYGIVQADFCDYDLSSETPRQTSLFNGEAF